MVLVAYYAMHDNTNVGKKQVVERGKQQQAIKIGAC